MQLGFSFLAAFAALVACAPSTRPAASPGQSQKLQVVVSTTILGDVVGQVGGEAINVQVLLPSGADPHTFEPAPRDMASISSADLVVINGAGLEDG
jgi:ABC-type Zn uptake system ZnuABC Zn-binding protein ZnuA